jgi:uncharacterized coiled-coil DUF342 family protein
MNILEEIKKLETAKELRDEIELVEEQIYELESDCYDVNDELYPTYAEYEFFQNHLYNLLRELKSKNKTISQEILDYYTKNNTIRKIVA